MLCYVRRPGPFPFVRVLYALASQVRRFAYFADGTRRASRCCHGGGVEGCVVLTEDSTEKNEALHDSLYPFFVLDAVHTAQR